MLYPKIRGQIWDKTNFEIDVGLVSHLVPSGVNSEDIDDNSRLRHLLQPPHFHLNERREIDDPGRMKAASGGRE